MKKTVRKSASQRFNDLGHFFRVKREQKGLSQMDVAEELGYASSQYISNWERGLCAPSYDRLPKLTKLLGLRKEDVIKVILDHTRHELEDNFGHRR